MAPAPRPAGIVLGYRNDESAGQAGSIYDSLAARFGAERVSLVGLAAALPLRLPAAVPGSDDTPPVLVVVLGPGWAGVSVPGGGRLLADPADPVRAAVRMALDAGTPVVAALVDGARLPAAKDLPHDVRGLRACPSVTVSSRHGCDRLLAVVAEHLVASPAGAAGGTDGATDGDTEPERLPALVGAGVAGPRAAAGEPGFPGPGQPGGYPGAGPYQAGSYPPGGGYPGAGQGGQGGQGGDYPGGYGGYPGGGQGDYPGGGGGGQGDYPGGYGGQGGYGGGYPDGGYGGGYPEGGQGGYGGGYPEGYGQPGQPGYPSGGYPQQPPSPFGPPPYGGGGPPDPNKRRQRQRTIVIGSLVAALAVIGVVLALALGGGDDKNTVVSPTATVTAGPSTPPSTPPSSTFTSPPETTTPSPAASGSPHAYPMAIEQSFLRGCTSGDTAKNPYCRCALTEIEKKYTLSEFIDLQQSYSRGDKEAQDKILDLAFACVDKLRTGTPT